jgi:DNA-binding PadR family transcriptional regulator
MVVVEQEAKEGCQTTTRTASLKKHKKKTLTTADLVLLSLLSENPMHGYQANAELERRDIRDWAAISRPQIYYSLEKLARLGLLRPVKHKSEAAGPEKQSFAVTNAGEAALADALERGDWSTQRDKPAFLTWMALSWKARKGVFERQLLRREAFLERELEREKETLQSVLEEVGHPHHEAVWMVTLMIEQFEIELRWIAMVKKQAKQRGPARNYTHGRST